MGFFRGGFGMKLLQANTGLETQARRVNLRDVAEDIADNSEPVCNRDKIIINLYFKGGLSPGQIGQILDMSGSSVGRRIKKIAAAMWQVWMFKERHSPGEEEMGIINDYYLGGFSIEEISIKRAVTIYMIRKTLDKTKSISKLRKVGRARSGDSIGYRV
jgi:predicted DNA-binding protein YlxM (UPF0122 family)